MTEQISITIPLIPSVLKHSAEMLINLADDLAQAPVVISKAASDTLDLNPVETEAINPQESPEAVAEFNAQQDTPPAPKEVFGDTPPAPDTEETRAITIEEITEAEVNAGNLPPAPSAVELDSAGLPWDVRIHAGSKGKLAKTQQWKKKRGVDQALVDQVEAELHAAMAIPPVATLAQAAPATEAPVITAADIAINTFPKLMAAITAKGIDPDTVQGAVGVVGLASLPLVATRPDLIPQLAASLGL